MASSVLVAFATRYGSTQEVAEAVATALRDTGLEVDVRPLKEVKSLEGYQAVVMGAPLQMFRWHKDAMSFLKRHRKALQDLPVAVFALGPFNDVEKEWREVGAQLDKELAKHPWFEPAEKKIVGGRFDPAFLSGRWKLLPALSKLPKGDIRDWDDIAAWGRSLPEKLGLASS